MYKFTWQNPVKVLPFADSIQLRCSLCGDPPPLDRTDNPITTYLLQISQSISVHRDCLSCASDFDQIKPDFAYSEAEVSEVVERASKVECGICTIGGATVRLEDKTYHLNCIKNQTDFELILEKLSHKQTEMERIPLKPTLEANEHSGNVVEHSAFLQLNGHADLKSVLSPLCHETASECQRPLKRTPSSLGKENSQSKVSKRRRSSDHDVKSPLKNNSCSTHLSKPKEEISQMFTDSIDKMSYMDQMPMIDKMSYIDRMPTINKMSNIDKIPSIDKMPIVDKMPMIDKIPNMDKMRPHECGPRKRLSNDSGVSLQSDRFEDDEMPTLVSIIEEAKIEEQNHKLISYSDKNSPAVTKVKDTAQLNTAPTEQTAAPTATDVKLLTVVCPKTLGTDGTQSSDATLGTADQLLTVATQEGATTSETDVALLTDAQTAISSKRVRRNKSTSSSLNEEIDKVNKQKLTNSFEACPVVDINSNKSVEDVLPKRRTKRVKKFTENDEVVETSLKKSKSSKAAKIDLSEKSNEGQSVENTEKPKQTKKVEAETKDSNKRKTKKVLLDPQKPRTYYSTNLNLPMSPSHDDEARDLDWLKKLQARMIDEFIDINEGEKSFITLWNEHLLMMPCYGDKMIKENLEAFVDRFGVRIYRGNLYRNFIVHLSNLVEFAAISPTDVFQIITQLQKLFQRIIDDPDSFPENSSSSQVDVVVVEEDLPDPVNDEFYARLSAESFAACEDGDDETDNFHLYLSDDDDDQVSTSNETSPSRACGKFYSAVKSTFPHLNFNQQEDPEISFKPIQFADVNFVDDSDVLHHFVDRLIKQEK